MPTILVVEDEPKMQSGLKDNLQLDGYDVEVASDGEEGLRKISGQTFDLIILDIMLPKLSGFDLCKKVRADGIKTPIIMLTAKGEEIDKVVGLEPGADDYITKPFQLREFLARVKAVLRRAGEAAGETGERLVLGSLVVDFAAYTARRGESEIEMTPKEFDILRYFWQHRNKSVGREELLSDVWGYNEAISTRTVDNFIMKLRQKIEEDPAHPKHLITIHGVGYKLIA